MSDAPITPVSEDDDFVWRLRHPLWAHSQSPFHGPQLSKDETVADLSHAADEIEKLKARLAIAESAVDVLESNGRAQGRLLADTGEKLEAAKKALEKSLTENAWNAYYCGVTKEGGKWMDGGRSEGEWLRGEMDLGPGWHDCKMIQDRIPEVVAKQIDALFAHLREG